MSHIEHWKRQLRAARIARPAHEQTQRGGGWDARRSSWFNRFAGQNDRSHTYRFFEPYVRGQVLEVGPGPGAYTRLMVARAERVVAVEPSPFMVQCLRANLRGAANLEIVESTIEDYSPRLETYDFALAANVVRGIERIDEVLCGVVEHAAILAIVTWAYDTLPEWLQGVRAQFAQSARGPDMPNNADLLGVLQELGLPHQVHRVDAPYHVFSRLEDAVLWVEGYCSLDPAWREQLAQIVTPCVIEQGGGFLLPSGRETLVIIVHREGNA
ncbi:MAG: class I SAM-dependent methyltransferase [Chloroflexi bacterium]|nr:class I SAM-dependent methyltransferase [Chloroflexota bacterium]